MPTTAPATVPSPQMVFCRKDHEAVFIAIEIADRNCFRRPLSTLLGKFPNALSADTGSVFQFRRDTCKQFLRNRNAYAPARSFMTGNPAELTIIRATAKRAKLRPKRLLAKILTHLFAFR
jgi:hypothetical protein